ncbi:hypothetical protein B566_EDAN016588 [Ephemera danica]|nr:hypothetical protein B566_EDAN016588 [Ephemera danica]
METRKKKLSYQATIKLTIRELCTHIYAVIKILWTIQQQKSHRIFQCSNMDGSRVIQTYFIFKKMETDAVQIHVLYDDGRKRVTIPIDAIYPNPDAVPAILPIPVDEAVADNAAGFSEANVLKEQRQSIANNS